MQATLESYPFDQKLTTTELKYLRKLLANSNYQLETLSFIANNESALKTLGDEIQTTLTTLNETEDFNFSSFLRAYAGRKNKNATLPENILNTLFTKALSENQEFYTMEKIYSAISDSQERSSRFAVEGSVSIVN